MSKRIESSPESSRLSMAFNNLAEEDHQNKFLQAMMGQLWPIVRPDLTKPIPEVREAINFTFNDEQGMPRSIGDIQREMIAFTNQQAVEARQEVDKLISLIKRG